MKSVKLRFWFNGLIVAAFVAMVTAPLVRSEFHREVARWYVAAAVNSYEDNDLPAAKNLLSVARQWSGEVVVERDYLRARLTMAAESEFSEGLLEILDESLAIDPSNKSIARDVAKLLGNKLDFQSALKAVKRMYPDESQLYATGLNEIAYFRALAGVELDIAERQIDEALAEFPDDESLLDTKAWVLYKQGRYAEALGLLDLAIEKIERTFPPNLTPPGKMFSLGIGEAWGLDKHLPEGMLDGGADLDESSDGDQADLSESVSASDSAADNQSAKPGDVENPNGEGDQKVDPTSANATEPTESTSEIDDVFVTPQEQASTNLKLQTAAVMRYHRGRVLEALKRPLQAQRDFDWLRDWRYPVNDTMF